MALAADRGSYIRLLGHKGFRRFVVAQSLSSLGDWIGMIAILALVARITRDEFAVAAMLLARIGPALVLGPVAGVFVDRWNRKRVMVACDLGRAALIAMLPFLEAIQRAIPPARPVLMLFLVSAMLETLTLLWQASKDAALPLMVTRSQLTHANSMMLIAAYGTFPLSGAAFGLLIPASHLVGRTFPMLAQFQVNEEHLAFALDSFTFLVSALVTSTLAIPVLAKSRRRADLKGVVEEFVEGLRNIQRDPRIRPWLFGIGLVFAGVGAFLATAVFYVTDVLSAGSAGFGLMVTAVGVGLAAGFLLAGILSRLIPRDVLFSGAVGGMGISLIAFGSVSTLASGLAMGAILGFFVGLSYPSGLTLMQENVSHELRGRIMSSMYSVVRLATFGSLALAPALAKVVGDPRVNVLGRDLDLRGVRVVMWLGGVAILLASVVTAQAVVARWRGMIAPYRGIFLVFEGGEGSGKSTQMERLSHFLKSMGHSACITREPGGTGIGDDIRRILLDTSSVAMSPKTEALLYAADRAQHVEQVIKPALERGEIVISDRYLYSSLAYQGVGRGLGIDEILDLNRWATGGLLPDLVFWLDFDPELGLERSTSVDRIESEDLSFHQSVRDAYRLLSERYPKRFVVIDAGADEASIEADIRKRVERVLSEGRPERLR